MRILLVDPGFGKKSWGTFGQSHWSSIIHQGLCGLSACAKQAGFTDLHLLDFRTLKGWEQFESEFLRIKPDVVGLTMRSCDTLVVAEIAARIKALRKETVTVVGGVHVSLDPKRVQQDGNFDFVMAGEGEVSFVKLLQALAEKKEFPRFMWGERPDLDALPLIDRRLYPYETTIALPNYEGIFHPPMVTMLASRGCLYNCSFCAPHARTHFGPGLRKRSVRNVIDELKLLYERYRFESVKFYDYTFTQDPAWVAEFCEGYAAIRKPFWIQSRADLVCRHPDLLAKLRGVGLAMVGIGFESGSDKVLKFLRKGTTRAVNLKAAQIVKSTGVLLSASFMLGIPEETEADVAATVSLAREMRPQFTSLAFFTPIPGNDLYKYCKDRDLVISDDPELLIEFSPEVPKIKGKDYDRLRKAAAVIMGDRFGGSIVGELIRFLYTRTKYHYKLRSFLVQCYIKWVSSRLYGYLFNKSEQASPKD